MNNTKTKTDEVIVWGTWEELVLGGAVVRYGTGDWNLIAAELRARTTLPFDFTAQDCQAKYEDLQQRYSGCGTWFEELRKHRIAELSHVLEQSEDSIGSLRSKIQSLKAEKRTESCVDNDSSQPESLVPYGKSEGSTSSSRETSKDGLSAGSFTQATRMNWSPEYQASAPSPARERETTPEAPESPEKESSVGAKDLTEMVALSWGPNSRKRRGKRKRRENIILKETSFLASADMEIKSCWRESSLSNVGKHPRPAGVGDCSKSLEIRDGVEVLMKIYNSVLENKSSSVFHHRLDGQKRRRYKEIIRQHIDFDTIKLRIARGSIRTKKELFRDLLLLTNNALVFYSKRTREYKSALLLREDVTKMLQQHCESSSAKEPLSNLPSSFKPSIGSHLVKPQSACPRSQKPSKKLPNSSNASKKAPLEARSSDNANSPPLIKLLALGKKVFGQSKKVGRQSISQRLVKTSKSRKRLFGK